LQTFLQLPNVDRCYLLNQDGVQLGDNLSSLMTTAVYDLRFEPLKDATNAVWIRRNYFQKALREPEVLQVSSPYLSITGGNLCVTLSIAIAHLEGAVILCGDIQWTDKITNEISRESLLMA